MLLQQSRQSQFVAARTEGPAPLASAEGEPMWLRVEQIMGSSGEPAVETREVNLPRKSYCPLSLFLGGQCVR